MSTIFLSTVPCETARAGWAARVSPTCRSSSSTGAVHLTALYRSHDYGYKVPGNLLGLARLQSCVASETGQHIGGLVVHSSYALLSGSRTGLRTLLSDLRHTAEPKEVSGVMVR